MGNSDPEDASTFLTRTNFKSIVEWLTAEAILNRPEDPMTFLRDLLDMKIHERGVEPYAAEHASRPARYTGAPSPYWQPVVSAAIVVPSRAKTRCGRSRREKR